MLRVIEEICIKSAAVQDYNTNLTFQAKKRKCDVRGSPRPGRFLGNPTFFDILRGGSLGLTPPKFRAQQLSLAVLFRVSRGGVGRQAPWPPCWPLRLLL